MSTALLLSCSQVFVVDNFHFFFIVLYSSMFFYGTVFNTAAVKIILSSENGFQ